MVATAGRAIEWAPPCGGAVAARGCRLPDGGWAGLESVVPNQDPDERSGWDTGYVPLVMIAIGYASVLVPAGSCLLGVLTGAFGLLVAACIALGDRMEAKPISRATRWSFVAVVLFPVWLLLLRGIR